MLALWIAVVLLTLERLLTLTGSVRKGLLVVVLVIALLSVFGVLGGGLVVRH